MHGDPINPRYYGDLGEYAPVYVIQKWELGFELGNAAKYIQRAGHKTGEDEIVALKKAIWYINSRIHFLDPSEPDPASSE